MWKQVNKTCHLKEEGKGRSGWEENGGGEFVQGTQNTGMELPQW
jgi:hypothetical protein